MAIIRTKDVRKLGDKDLDKKLNELRLELTKERANIAIGASATSPGRIKEIRKSIARIRTVKNQKSSGIKGEKVKG
ncbi:MAG: 50S ribosomal protein L29 [Candidatus Aenigmatarchaeota archaeon]|nr:MAG: 50S ribosomal protein L29 [Candidatus Aenigmarchaeota archaeon]